MEAFVSGNMLGSLNLGGGLKQKASGVQTVLYQKEFPGFELPGMIEANPVFSIYSVSSVSSNEQVSFNSNIVSTAKDFHISLLSIGGHEKSNLLSSNQFELSSGPNSQRKQMPLDRFSLSTMDKVGGFMKRSWSGVNIVNSELSIVADFQVKYKIMGSPKSELNVGIKNSILGSYGYLAPDDQCPNHLSGNVFAVSSLFADIGTFKHILKDTPAIPVWEGCFVSPK